MQRVLDIIYTFRRRISRIKMTNQPLEPVIRKICRKKINFNLVGKIFNLELYKGIDKG